MAIKKERYLPPGSIETTLASKYVGARGLVLCHQTAGSGEVLGDSLGYVDLFPNPSGKIPAGIALVDVVNTDQTRYHLNFHKEEQASGTVIPLATKGWLVTDAIIGTPTMGDIAYLTSSGYVTPTMHITGGRAATPPIGRFQGGKDEAGYARVELNLPVVF